MPLSHLPMAVARKTKKTPLAPPASKRKKPAAPLGRYLRRFTLQNVRTFRSPVTLDFCREDGSVAQWTVILGENGTGKTTLLQYLAGMVPIALVDIRNHSHNSKVYWPILAGFDWVEWHMANLCHVPSQESDAAQIQATLHASSAASNLEKAKPKKELTTRISIGFRGRSGRYFNDSRGAEYPSNSSYHQQYRLYAYGASRHVAGSSSPYLSSESFFRKSVSESTGTLYQDDIPLISPEQWFLGLDHTSRGKGEPARLAKRAFTSAQRCLVNVLPDLVGMAVKPHLTSQGQTQMMLFCETPFGEVPFSALSLGYRTMAAWLTDFVKRMHEAFPGLGEPDDGPAVLLIDEFDLHMHPKWQRRVMESLSKEFPNTQFIVTAHSPLIVQATEGHAKLIVLKRKEREDGTEEVIAINDPHYAAGWRVDQILASDLYDLSPRAPTYAALMEERVRLRQREKRTAAEEQRLASVEAELERAAPSGVSVASEQLVADLRRALERAEQRQPAVGK